MKKQSSNIGLGCRSVDRKSHCDLFFLISAGINPLSGINDFSLAKEQSAPVAIDSKNIVGEEETDRLCVNREVMESYTENSSEAGNEDKPISDNKSGQPINTTNAQGSELI